MSPTEKEHNHDGGELVQSGTGNPILQTAPRDLGGGTVEQLAMGLEWTIFEPRIQTLYSKSIRHGSLVIRIR
jgi:hypothetical protein